MSRNSFLNHIVRHSTFGPLRVTAGSVAIAAVQICRESGSPRCSSIYCVYSYISNSPYLKKKDADIFFPSARRHSIIIDVSKTAIYSYCAYLVSREMYNRPRSTVMFKSSKLYLASVRTSQRTPAQV